MSSEDLQVVSTFNPAAALEAAPTYLLRRLKTCIPRCHRHISQEDVHATAVQQTVFKMRRGLKLHKMHAL